MLLDKGGGMEIDMRRNKKIITERELELFRKHLVREEKAPGTIAKYIRDVSKLKAYARGRTLSKTLLLQYKKHLEDSGRYKASSINSYLVAVNHFCRVMGWAELCTRTIRVQRTAFETEEMELTMDEYRRLIRASVKMGDERTALIIQTLGSTGIRVGELQYIVVECLKSGVADVYNKGKVRRILLPSVLQQILKAYAEKCSIHKGPIFCTQQNHPIDRRNIWRRMKKVGDAAGIAESKVFPHNLRHLFAREFYKQTNDIVKLADVLGHSSIETTRIYIKSTGREHKQQLDRMNMVVEGGAWEAYGSGLDQVPDESRAIHTDQRHSKGQSDQNKTRENTAEENKTKESVTEKNTAEKKSEKSEAKEHETEEKMTKKN